MMLIDLLNNAIDAIKMKDGYQPNGNEKITISLQTEESPKEAWAALSIKDTGSGMDQDALRNLFEPFFTTKPTGQGSGLGMTLIQQVVQEHNGRISVRSEPGKGAEIFIHLPIYMKLEDGTSIKGEEA